MGRLAEPEADRAIMGDAALSGRGHALSAALRWFGLELVPRDRVAFVRDASDAERILRRGPSGADLSDDELRRTAAALVRGEVVLVYPDHELPLDPPNPNAVPLLSDLADVDPSEPVEATSRRPA